MTGLKILYLIGNQIDGNACKILAPALKAMTGLKQLYLNENQIDGNACEYLAPVLEAMTGLETLYLGGNNIPEGDKAMAGGIFRRRRKATGKELMKSAWRKAGKPLTENGDDDLVL